jgi:hypothetical protein
MSPHIRWLRASLRSFWHYWRLPMVLLAVLCICVQPIASGISCRAPAPGLSPFQQADTRANLAALASQPDVTLVRTVVPASGAPASDADCSYIGGGAPRSATATPLFFDKVILAAGLALVGASLLRRIPLDALLLPPLLRFPPPTPPPIAAFHI